MFKVLKETQTKKNKFKFIEECKASFKELKSVFVKTLL